MQPTGRRLRRAARAEATERPVERRFVRALGRWLAADLPSVRQRQHHRERGRERQPRGELLSIIITFAGCGGAPQPTVQVHGLPSGEEVKVLGVGRINFPRSGPALMLKYQTDLRMDDTSALHAEVQRIWAE